MANLQKQLNWPLRYIGKLTESHKHWSTYISKANVLVNKYIYIYMDKRKRKRQEEDNERDGRI